MFLLNIPRCHTHTHRLPPSLAHNHTPFLVNKLPLWPECNPAVLIIQNVEVIVGSFIKASFLGLEQGVSQAPYCLTCPHSGPPLQCVINETAGRTEQWSLQWHIVLLKISSGNVLLCSTSGNPRRPEEFPYSFNSSPALFPVIFI